jgi:hypothetical protein
MRPRWFWYLLTDDLESAKGQKNNAQLDSSDIRKLRKMMDRKQAELDSNDPRT